MLNSKSPRSKAYKNLSCHQLWGLQLKKMEWPIMEHKLSQNHQTCIIIHAKQELLRAATCKLYTWSYIYVMLNICMRLYIYTYSRCMPLFQDKHRSQASKFNGKH